MDHDKISRRDLLKGAAAGASSLALARMPALPLSGASPSPAPSSASSTAGILPLTSASDVFIPPRGQSFFKFSFDFPEPSLEFAGLRFSFRVYTFENAYALDRDAMTVQERPDGVELACSQFLWAGGQQKASGSLRARFQKIGDRVEWSAVAEMPQPIKSMAAIIRGVPRGRLSAGGQPFFDPKDNEVLLGYPFGGGALFTAAVLNTPLAVIQTGASQYFYLSALNDSVRANRFYFQPGETSYRVELVYEQAGWQKSNTLHSPLWRVGRAPALEAAFRPHFEHLEKAFSVPDWETRSDVPAWFRHTALVLAFHGMHWTGYIFNDFARMLAILRWVATRIPARNVMVFLPAWDGRYYWNYPLYQPDPRLGGEEGFRRLISEGQKMGFHLVPMFGTNAANSRLPQFSKFADATTEQIDGDAFNLNWVDWDNDRHNEGGMPYMNVGVDSWRSWLLARISEIIERFGVDGYFLDIAGGWENNTKADTHEGTRRLVEELRRKHPGALAIGEMHYDALLSFIPVYQVLSESAYPRGLTKYARSFQHLSHPAPGRGSSGVHESGFARFDPKTLDLNDAQIPTITVVDDTFDRYR
ncbi:MAG TPA: twin-arginine translocation signal domain-containing protein, partial [Terriglobales bacterium]|nr:twin-arginine translocation signal domain-containing protein [Terriglobales bacterium]